MWGWLGGEQKKADEDSDSWDPLAAASRRDAERVAALDMVSPNRRQQRQHLQADVARPASFMTPTRPSSVPMVGSPFQTPVRKVPDGFESPSKSMDFQDYSLLVDYRHLSQRLPAGMHVSPGAEAAQWSAVYFPRAGPYCRGAFRFVIVLAGYPMQPPHVQMLTRLYHPLVSVSSGAMDLASVLPAWVPQRHRVWHVLQAMEACMVNPAPVTGEGRTAANQDANHALQSDPRLFLALAAQCASEASLAMEDVLSGRIEPPAAGFALCKFESSMMADTHTQ